MTPNSDVPRRDPITTLADKLVFLDVPQYEVFGKYNPEEDGFFNSEIFSDSELTLVHGTDPNLTKPGLAVVDNIDPWNQHGSNCNAFAFGNGNGNNPNGFFADI